jgi:hypothetical protein
VRLKRSFSDPSAPGHSLYTSPQKEGLEGQRPGQAGSQRKINIRQKSKRTGEPR